MAPSFDVEDKKDLEEKGQEYVADVPVSEWGYYNRWTKRLLTWGVESRGIQPIPEAHRTDTQYSKIFFIWFSANCNILSFSAGTLGPVVFGLGLRDSCLCILFFNLFCVIPPAYLATWGPKLGMRQMIISRYSFGYYGVIIPCIFNLIGMIGFSILNCILGGQALASVSNDNLSWTVGIVIIAVVSLLVSFCGYKILNWYERVAWIPVVISFVVALGVGGKHLSSPPPETPATPVAILTFASTLAGFIITWSSLSSDFTSYFRSDVSSWRIFLYSYFGFLLPIVTLQMLGAAVAVAAPSVPAWDAGYTGGNVGGLLEAMLQPTKGFGKFLTVLLSLSVAGNIAATFYSISLNIQIFIPPLVVVPRYVFSIVATAIVVPVSIVGATRFYDALVNFLGLIGYWASAFIGIILMEHLVFRRNDPKAYDVAQWNVPRRLPSGIAALGAGICSFGLVVPCMEQVWFIGPIGKSTGDIGFEVAFVVSVILYVPFRALEVRLRKSVQSEAPDSYEAMTQLLSPAHGVHQSSPRSEAVETSEILAVKCLSSLHLGPGMKFASKLTKKDPDMSSFLPKLPPHTTSKHRSETSANMDSASAASRRLLSVHNHISSIPEKVDGLVVVLPRGGKVTANTTTDAKGSFTELHLNKTHILTYHHAPSDAALSLELSAIGTRYEGATTHIPKAPVLDLSSPVEANGLPKEIAVADAWTAIYALFTLYRTHAHIPIRLASSIPNAEELRRYLLITGLGRLYQGSKDVELARSVIFLSRAGFWQGAGTTGYHDRGWLLSPTPIFPSLPSFTRSEMVIASHPLRPPKPRGGEVLYRRYCVAVGQTLEFVAFDLDGQAGPDGISQHMAAFHRWHNDERVNSAWGERGSLETHRQYIEGLLKDPGVLPLMMSWDGELMGYVEMVWVKENHVAQYYPPDTPVGEWDRAIHVLVGEEKFLGGGRSEIWLRSLTHYAFLADPRTERALGEPKESNIVVVKVGSSAGYHRHTIIDFPYKRSELMLSPRERFFNKCLLY
ncbi:Purine-cytosine permease fcyB [Hypsizygus marmoreus]|uniref:Purine-cytosine permease fcyB n=1 Tax=Hypsizygus marmoreus TaxID=39966 RepID=A0A369K6W3_HYPMA|nr:Purine-cytosine permease fcyB [Hypsizygus marmoreus]